MHIATDDDVRRVPASEVVALIRDGVLAHATGKLAAPARLVAPLSEIGDVRLLFTVGGTDSLVGFRVYANGEAPLIEQLTAVYDRSDGSLTGLVTGLELGARRTAALGAVAADALARPDASTLGMVGTGLQALAHVWAVQAIRPLEQVRVFSRNAERRAEFARRCESELGVTSLAVDDARAAVDGADLVTLATTSNHPVIEADWVAPGAHVATLGPKTADSHEAPVELAERATVLVTDSMRQLVGYGAPSWLTLAPGLLDRVQLLEGILAGTGTGRTSDTDITLFCSVGLAGTELLLARRVLEGAG